MPNFNLWGNIKSNVSDTARKIDVTGVGESSFNKKEPL
jgi:hypothetical protein